MRYAIRYVSYGMLTHLSLYALEAFKKKHTQATGINGLDPMKRQTGIHSNHIASHRFDSNGRDYQYILIYRHLATISNMACVSIFIGDAIRFGIYDFVVQIFFFDGIKSNRELNKNKIGCCAETIRKLIQPCFYEQRHFSLAHSNQYIYLLFEVYQLYCYLVDFFIESK